MRLDSYTKAHNSYAPLDILWQQPLHSSEVEPLPTEPCISLFLFVYTLSSHPIYALFTSPETVSSICLSVRPSRDCAFSLPNSMSHSEVSVLIQRSSVLPLFPFLFLVLLIALFCSQCHGRRGLWERRTESSVDFREGACGFAEEDRGVWVGFLDGGVLFCEE